MQSILTAIYIPIWLDLLLMFSSRVFDVFVNLHSNMVRFIMPKIALLFSLSVEIYIPIWLDLL